MAVSIHAPRFREAMLYKLREFLGLLGEFQSTPPVSGRRCQGQSADYTAAHLVSIHAPRFREAMPFGEAEDLKLFSVSIHAPRFREAMPSASLTPMA